MVIMLQIPPREALRIFAIARGHDIERKNYVDSIISHDGNLYLKNMIEMNSNRSGPIVYPQTPNFIPFSQHPPRRSRIRGNFQDEYFYQQGSSRDHRHGDRSNRYYPTQSGARRDYSGHYQRDKTFSGSDSNRSRRRRDDNQNYNN